MLMKCQPMVRIMMYIVASPMSQMNSIVKFEVTFNLDPKIGRVSGYGYCLEVRGAPSSGLHLNQKSVKSSKNVKF